MIKNFRKSFFFLHTDEKQIQFTEKLQKKKIIYVGTRLLISEIMDNRTYK